MKPIWREDHECWGIPINCPCCQKCLLMTDKEGKPLIYVDKFGNEKTRCINGGPYLGYIEV